MAVVGDNQTKMSKSFTLDKPIGSAQDVRIRFNLEFLKGCTFHCPGCYVNRDNAYSQKDLDIVFHAQQEFKQNGYVFDEIILGPTDFFAAYNTELLVQNPKFTRLFDSQTVLTILSTLQSDEDVIKRRIDLVNEHITNDIEVEILIPFDHVKIIENDQSYIQMLKSKIALLERLNCDVEYAFQMNIQNIENAEDFDLKKVSDLVWKELGTITEFNPSFMRVPNDKLVLKIIKNWNKMLVKNIKKEDVAGDEQVTFTMANKNHAGFNEITYNFSKGAFYSCPFIYENVFDKADNFLVPAQAEDGFYQISDFLDHRDIINQNQLSYLTETKECANCPHAISCVSKQVIDYMMSKNIKECILAKDVLDLYDD